MRLRCLNNLIILSDHNFSIRLINNFGVIGPKRPTVQTCVSFVEIIYLIITGFGLTGMDCGCREALMYCPGRLQPAVSFWSSDPSPGLRSLMSSSMRYTPCFSTQRIL